MWHMDGDWGWWMLMGWLWMILFWGAIIAAVVYVVSRLSGRDTRSQDQGSAPADQPSSNALAILEERYARGEITRDEFEEMRRTLRGG